MLCCNSSEITEPCHWRVPPRLGNPRLRKTRWHSVLWVAFITVRRLVRPLRLQSFRFGSRTWLVRVSLSRDPETGTRKYHNKTIWRSFREAQTSLSGKLQERGIGRLAGIGD